MGHLSSLGLIGCKSMPPLIRTYVPPLLVQRCNGIGAGLGYLEVGWVAHAIIPSVSLWPHYHAEDMHGSLNANNA